MHPLLLIAAALGGGWYLWKRSKSQLTSALPSPTPSYLPGGGGGSIYQPTTYQQDAANFPAGQYVVSTQTDPLNLRGDPSTSNPPVGELSKGSTVQTDGVVTAGFTGIVDGNGSHLGWAATEYLTPVSGGVVQTGFPAASSGGFNPGYQGPQDPSPAQFATTGFVGAGYAVPLNVALQTQRCLNKMGCRPALPLTGYWDAHTQQCLADFQHQNGLQVTGQADPYTRQLLQHICS